MAHNDSVSLSGGPCEVNMSVHTPTAHVLYENADWLPPLVAGLEAEGFTVRLVELTTGLLEGGSVPAEGIWINRVSPSSHTRGHSDTVQLARDVLYWLEFHGRRVINGLEAYEFEMSKLRQDLILNRYGIRTPKTVLAVGKASVVDAAKRFSGPFITKHNQGGKGLGIQLFRNPEALEAYVYSDAFDAGPDGKIILQEYIDAPHAYITRVELIGDQFLFAMRSNTEEGFQLCPSDACQIPEDAGVCPAEGPSSKFSLSPITEEDPLVQKYLKLLQGENIDIAGIEFIEDSEGNRYTYDINGTTNYSGVLAEKTGIDGMREFARWLRESEDTRALLKRAS